MTDHSTGSYLTLRFPSDLLAQKDGFAVVAGHDLVVMRSGLQEQVDRGLFPLVVDQDALEAFADQKPDTPLKSEVRQDFDRFRVILGPGARLERGDIAPPGEGGAAVTLTIAPGEDVQFPLVKDGEQWLAVSLQEQDFLVGCFRTLNDTFFQLKAADQFAGDFSPGQGDCSTHQKHIFPEMSQMS